MLSSLTATAVRRGWPPAVYGRLVSQLNDSEEPGERPSVLDTLLAQVREDPPNPLLFEYIVLLSSEPYDLVPFPALLDRFAGESVDARPQCSIDLMAYLARGGVAGWNLRNAVADAEVLRALEALLDQANGGCRESRLFMLAIINQISSQVESVPSELEHKCDLLKASVNPNNKMDETRDEESEPHTKGLHASSRSTRLLWLDWALRSAQNLDFAYLKPQLDLMWPGDRIPVVTYELCVTAFDVLAAENHVWLALPFITKRLPLMLQEMAQGESLDGVIARLFTTLDKNVVETVETEAPGVRTDFGIACTDLGLCDPSVLHILHRNHAPQPPASAMPDASELLKPEYPWQNFLTLDLPSQQYIARQYADIVRGSSVAHGAISRHALAQHCVQLYNSNVLTDTLFVHIAAQDLIECVCAHADAAAQMPEEGGASGLVYADLGILLAVLDKWKVRYNRELPKQSWSDQFLARKMFGNVVDLTAEQKELMGQWIVGLFSGSSSGIADELLKPFTELSIALPVLLQQAVRAYRSAVIDRETLKTGLDYFQQQFSVTLFTPLTLRVLYKDLLEGMHTSSSLECLFFFLGLLATKRGPEFIMAKCVIAPSLKKILSLFDMVSRPETSERSSRSGTPSNADKSGTNSMLNIIDTTNVNVRKLIDELNPLITSILQQVDEKHVTKASQPISLSEVVKSKTAALMNWQLKPQGVPCTPAFLISRRVKTALGVEKTLSLIQKITLNRTQSSLETYSALLVADGLWQGPPLMPENETDSESARDLLDKLRNVLRMLEEKDGAKPTVHIGASETNAAGTNQTKAPEATTNDTGNDVVMNDGDMVADSMLNDGLGTGMLGDNLGGNSMGDAMMGGDSMIGDGLGDSMMGDGLGDSMIGSGLDKEFGNQYDYGLDDSKRQDFDGDFSKPMDLADLDSAMDFGWN